MSGLTTLENYMIETLKYAWMLRSQHKMNIYSDHNDSLEIHKKDSFNKKESSKHDFKQQAHS